MENKKTKNNEDEHSDSDEESGEYAGSDEESVYSDSVEDSREHSDLVEDTAASDYALNPMVVEEDLRSVVRKLMKNPIIIDSTSNDNEPMRKKPRYASTSNNNTPPETNQQPRYLGLEISIWLPLLRRVFAKAPPFQTQPRFRATVTESLKPIPSFGLRLPRLECGATGSGSQRPISNVGNQLGSVHSGSVPSFQSSQGGVGQAYAKIFRMNQFLRHKQFDQNRILWDKINCLQSELANSKSCISKLKAELNSLKPSEGQIANDDIRCDSAGKATENGKSGKSIHSVDAMPSTSNVPSAIITAGNYQDGENNAENLERQRSLSDPDNANVPSDQLIQTTGSDPSSTSGNKITSGDESKGLVIIAAGEGSSAVNIDSKKESTEADEIQDEKENANTSQDGNSTLKDFQGP